MPCRDIVVVGASAGGIEALRQITRRLPRDFQASVFVVVHFPQGGTSMLPEILSRDGALPAAHAVGGEPIVPGRIYVAPPDYHLLLEDGAISLSRGPRENGLRPAVDPMFRSAAVAFGPRVIGVVLSGNLDDGTSGLAAVKRRGGVALVQDPGDAMYGSMPKSAIAHVRVDRVAPATELASAIVECVADPAEDGGTSPMDEEAREIEFTETDMHAIEAPNEHPGEVSAFSCPDCGGVLWQIQEGDFMRFRCRVGHGWTADALVIQQGEQIDDALWAALRALEERASLLRGIAARYRRSGTGSIAERFGARADQMEHRAHIVRDLLVRHRGIDARHDDHEKSA